MFEDWNDDYDEWDEFVDEDDEEVNSLFGVITEADCPACFGHGSMKKIGEGLFKCCECGLGIDEQTLIETVVGLSSFMCEE